MTTKTYVVTGATSGIGESIVRELAKENIVFAGYRSESKGEELSKFSNNIYPFYVDYAKPDTISEALKFINSNCDKVDTLINIAGCVVAGPVEKVSINEVRRQFDVNVFGHIEMTQGLAEKLENGRIINVSSMASFGIFPLLIEKSISDFKLLMPSGVFKLFALKIIEPFIFPKIWFGKARKFLANVFESQSSILALSFKLVEEMSYSP